MKYVRMHIHTYIVLHTHMEAVKNRFDERRTFNKTIHIAHMHKRSMYGMIKHS